MVSVVNPWAKHQQSYWQEKVGSPSLPLWTRVYALAYGTHRRNGHSPLKAGELAVALTVVDRETGETHTPSPSRISEAINRAVELGFLHHDSNARCLVVPPWGISGGVLGSEHESCRNHLRSANSGRNVANLPLKAETPSVNSGNGKPVTCGNADSSKSLLNHGDPKANGESVA